MTYFLKSGSRYNVTTKDQMDLHDKLPVGTYTVKQDPRSGAYYLEAVEGFEVKGKVYGDTLKTADRILNTFMERKPSTGVLLSGEKGSGKTLLAKMLSIKAAEQDIPTIIINAPHNGEEFNGFMQTIEQPTVVIFDEFEKVYDNQEQQRMLTLLDGVYPSKKLFILTCNDKWRINEHMRNRPGRIFYRIDYTGLDHDFIVEYCHDNLGATEHIPAITRIAAVFPSFNFDMLKAMVEEMNRYNESPQEVMKVLNAKPEFSDSALYTVGLQIDGLPVPDKALESTRWHGNPLGQSISIDYLAGVKADDEDSGNWFQSVFTAKDLGGIEPGAGKFTFTNPEGHILALTKIVEKSFNYDAF